MLLGLAMGSLLLLSGGEIREAPRELRLRLVEVINADRKAAGLAPVEYSEELSKAADVHCRDMLEGGYVSHWNRDGWKPYLRYASLGIRDNTSENIHSMWSTEFREENLWDYMLDGHQAFMAEQPPNDGHRRAVLGERHTHVGIGLAFDKNGLRLIELFGGRYAEMDALPLRTTLKKNYVVSGRLLRRSDELLGISVLYEPLPEPMSRADLAGTQSYQLPTEERLERPRSAIRRYVDGSHGTIEISGSRFRVPLTFWKWKPGVYTVVVWIHAGGKPSFPGATTSILVEE